MSVNCFVGRGSLLVSLLGTSGGFFTLSGESEISVAFSEENESVFDARNGVIERVDWWIRSRGLSVLAECFRVEKEAIELLLKATYSLQAAGGAPLVLPSPVVLGQGYALKPNITPASVVVTDALAATVTDTKYEVDLDYGLITFNDVTGYTQPFSVDADWGTHQAFALHGKLQTLVKARFQGVNKASGEKVLAEFYRLCVDISPEFKLVQKPFSSMAIKMEALPDVSQTIDAALGQYGRIVLL